MNFWNKNKGGPWREKDDNWNQSLKTKTGTTKQNVFVEAYNIYYC